MLFTYTTEYFQKVNRRKSIDFFEEEQTIATYGRFFHKSREKFEKISLMFSSCSLSNPGDPQPNTLNYSLKELVG